MKNIYCQEIAFNSDLYNESIALRDKVLRKPLGLKFSKEELDLECDSHHLVCLYKEKVIGVIVLRPTDDTTFKMRQVAIATEFQRKGIGQQLVAFSEEFSKSIGISKIELHARDTAIPFYLKLKYSKVGEEFEEVGIKHFKMEKILSAK